MTAVYQERRSSRLPAVVWTGAGRGSVRVLPDGCMDVLWHDGTLTIAGPDTVAHLTDDSPDSRYTGLRFAPGLGPRFFGVPAEPLRDQRVPLDAVWPAAHVKRLTAALVDSPNPGLALEEAAVARLADAGSADPVLGEVARVAARGEPVAATALRLGLSERQLHRRCLVGFGYGAKQLHRIVRMNRALDLARAGVPLADTATQVGYADQAHLSRDVRALAGVSVRGLIR
ncbi:MAG TPA: helix-turn-helix domain-containing protein [Jiangellaceae bacterium]|nr:helix-turn-helix domain-containing protein [Jiangellaceae bacterium]